MKSILFISVVFLSSPSYAQQPIGLTELTKKALAGHPSLGSARADIEIARARKIGLMAPFQPQLSLNGYATTGSGSMIFPGTVDPLNYEFLPSGATGVANGAFMWRLFSFGRDRELAASGSAAIQSSEASLAAVSLDVTLNLRLAFTQALLKHDATETDRTGLENAQEILRVTQAQFDAGKVPSAFVLRAKAEEASAEQDLAIAEADETGAAAEVWEAAGMDQTGLLKLGDWDAVESAPKDLDEALKSALSRRPELKGLEDQARQMRSMASAVGKSALPELSLMGMNDVATRGGDTYKAGLVLSFPIGDGGQRRAEKMEAVASGVKADMELRQMRIRIGKEIVNAWAAWHASSKVSASAQSGLVSSEEAYRVALLRFEAGKAILAELTDARGQVSKARLAVGEAEAYRRRAWSQLERGLGE